MRRTPSDRVGLVARCTALILVAPVFVWADSVLQEESHSAGSLIEFAREGMIEARYCFLITLDDLGQPQARLMDAFEPEADMTVWMATKADTRKVRQLRYDPRATLAYVTGGGNGYVTLVGRARLVDDADEKLRRWKTGWEAFYPGGPSDPDFLLLRFTPARIELMDPTRDVGAGPFSPAILVRQDTAWVVHEGIDSH